jgi:leucine-rich repeat protein SHOC2
MKLVLCNNILEVLPESVLQFGNLASLDLSNNRLTFLPESLGTQLTNLTHLIIRNNLISDSEFPKDLSGLARTLKHLNISGNRFAAFPPQLLQLTGIPN